MLSDSTVQHPALQPAQNCQFKLSQFLNGLQNESKNYVTFIRFFFQLMVNIMLFIYNM